MMKATNVLALCGIVLILASGASGDGRADLYWHGDVSIPQGADGVTIPLYLSGVPANALVTSVWCSPNVECMSGGLDNFWTEDYEIYVGNSARGAWYRCIWDNTNSGYSNLLAGANLATEFDNDLVNLTWYISVRDNVTHGSKQGLGQLHNVRLTIYYHLPGPLPDLYDAGQEYGSVSPTAGHVWDPINVSCTIHNGGLGGADNVRIVFYQSKDATITTSDYYLGEGWVSIAPGQSVQVDFAFNIGDFGPSTPGTYYIGWVIDPSDRIAESNDDNNNNGYTSTHKLIVLGGGQAAVPNVLGMTQAQAQSALTAAGLTVGTVGTDFSNTVPQGRVIRQEPAGETAVDIGSAVALTISQGPPPPVVTVPNVVGMRRAQAQSALTSVGLTVGTIWVGFSDTVPAGCVRDQDPVDGTVVNVGSPVELTISQGPAPLETATVPAVIGMDQAQAQSALTAVGLTVGTKTFQCSSTVASGKIISQDPAAGSSVAANSAVHLTISSGLCGVTVPNVVGMGQAQASAALTAAGLAPGTITTSPSATVPSGQVISQDPPAGTQVASGAAVALVVSSGPPQPGQVQVPDVVRATRAAAEAALSASGLVAGTVAEVASGTVPKGGVVSQDPPAGRLVARGSAVNLFVSAGPAASIIWVSDGHRTIAGAATPDDQAWVDLLRSVGYEVDYQPPGANATGYWQTLDAERLTTLRAADLIIISGDTRSAAYSDNATEVSQWNSIKTPLILLNVYLAPSNRWLWIDSTNVGARQAYDMAQAVNLLHPVFEEVILDENGQVAWLDPAAAPGSFCCVNTAGAGNGHIIAARPDNHYVLIAEWAAGGPFYEGGWQTPGGRRMLFSAGTQETPGRSAGHGVYDLTLEGQSMFLNAVAYMIAKVDEVPDGLLAWWELDETAGDIVPDSAAGNDGVAYGAPVWQPAGGRIGGALRFDGVNDYVDTGLNQDLPVWTIAAWVKSPAAPRPGGSPSGPMHRENNYQLNWNHNSGGTWPGSVAANIGGWKNASLGPLQADTWYHLCGTFDGTSLKAYTNGVLITTTSARGTPSPETNTLKLGRHALMAQYFAGTVDDVRVYNRALSAAEVAALAQPSAPAR